MQSVPRYIWRTCNASAAQRVLCRQFSASSPSSSEALLIRDRLKTDLKTAMKAKDTLRSKVIRAVMAEATNAEKANPQRFNDATVMSLIKKGITQRKDSASQYTAAGREDLATAELEEEKILVEYLPAQLTESEIDAKLRDAIQSLGGDAPQMGRVLKAFWSNVDKAAVNGDLVTTRLKALLANQ